MDRNQPLVINVPKINDEISDFVCLFNLWEKLNQDNLKVKFDFSNCDFLRHNAVAFLGGLANLITYRGGEISFDWDSFQAPVKANLERNGFSVAFGGDNSPWYGNTIPYQQDINLNKEAITRYLRAMWLGRGWVNISTDLQDHIIGKVFEIYLNAFEHSKSPIGVFSCGQYYPKMQALHLSVVDFGAGIPYNVRNFLQKDISSGNALKWAFQPGNTTNANGVPRGVGLDLLKEFVNANGGKLEIYSHNGYACINNKTEFFEERQAYFQGTFINIYLKCTDKNVFS